MIDPDNKTVQSAITDVIQVNGSGAPPITASPSIVDLANAAVAAAEGPGSRVLGTITADITRAANEAGVEDRGSESSLGSLVADMQLWATSENPNYGGTPTQIAFMNPGGLRANLSYGTDGTVTYKQAAIVQPFANTLVTMTLTGAQIRQVLEEQWQPEGASRAKLALGISKGLSYTYVVDAPRGSHIVDIAFNGAPLDESASYRVVANSFLASGGDNFTTFAAGTDVSDSGLQSMIQKNFKAPTWINEVCRVLGGKGGGKVRIKKYE
ncbi:MAG: 5'-nucleotidase [Polyangiaceae bacterium]